MNEEIHDHTSQFSETVDVQPRRRPSDISYGMPEQDLDVIEEQTFEEQAFEESPVGKEIN